MLGLTNSFRRKDNLYVLGKSGALLSTGPTDVEKHLGMVLRDTADLSSYSEELDAHIYDWSTEYYLSSKRANLLRGFDFSSISSVLELGCKCGAMTRFLGGQGMVVDTLESNVGKAELAASRCRNLSRVRVSHPKRSMEHSDTHDSERRSRSRTCETPKSC